MPKEFYIFFLGNFHGKFRVKKICCESNDIDIDNKHAVHNGFSCQGWAVREQGYSLE